MATSYIPDREAEMDGWIANFRTLIAADPAKYDLTAADASAIAAAYAAWHAAYLIAVNPTTRTRGAVAAKNGQKVSVLRTVRGFANTIQINAGVPDALKIGLGIRPRDPHPSPVPPPASCPLLTLTGMAPGAHRGRIADGLTPAKRARPPWAAGVLLFRAVGPGPTLHPEEARFLGLVTRASFESAFTPADHGQTATYFARWTNAKGELGPWSPGASMPIAA